MGRPADGASFKDECRRNFTAPSPAPQAVIRRLSELSIASRAVERHLYIHDRQMRTPMARKPNYSFERQERDRAAAAKAAEKAAAKAERKAAEATEKAPSDED
jgi:hypothetical protein